MAHFFASVIVEFEATARLALEATLKADPTQTNHSIAVIFGAGDGLSFRGSVFFVGDETEWALSCLPYAARKVEYLLANPEAVTSFEGADGELLYGGGFRLSKGPIIAVSGLSQEADLVVGLLTAIYMRELDLEDAQKIAYNANEICRILFDRASSRLTW